MVADDRAELTGLLRRWSGGDGAAGEALLALVYDRIRALAASRLRAAGGNAPLQPTELVNELVINLLEAEIDWQDRAHFFRTVAVAMRNILHDLGRRRASSRTGGARGRAGCFASRPRPCGRSARGPASRSRPRAG